MQKRVVLLGAALLFVLVGFLPVLAMILNSLFNNGHFTLEAYQKVLTSARQLRLLANSFALALAVTFLTTLVGVPLGLILGKSDLPFRKFFTFVFVVPLLIPPYINAVSWADLLGKQGLLARLAGTQVAQFTSDLLFSGVGCVWVLFSTFLAIPLLFTVAFLKTIDPQLEEAGRLVAGWKTVLRGITLPLLVPGIALAALLVFLLTFGEFGIPNYLRFEVFPVESFTHFAAFYDFKTATALALPLAGITFLAVAGESLFLRESTYLLRPALHSSEELRIPLSKLRPWILSGVSLCAFIFVILPLIVLLVQSEGFGVYLQALSHAGDSLVRSLLFALIGATVLTAFGYVLGYLIRYKVFSFWRTLDSLTLFLFALPGTVIGIGLIILWNHPATNWIYATPLIVLLGYVAKYTALTSRLSIRQLAQLPPSMEEAAQICGAGWLRRQVFIVLPLLKKSLLASWIVAFIFTLRDTEITMLVYPAGQETFPVRILTLMANGAPELIAALCVIMIAATLIPAAGLWLIPWFKT